MANKLLDRVSLLLIAIPLIVTAYIGWPWFLAELNFQLGLQSSKSLAQNAFVVHIPALGLSEVITPEVDPFDPGIYQPILEKSVAHAVGSALPGEEGSIFLFAHSSSNPLSLVRYNTAFYLLPKLRSGDQIQLQYQNQNYTYQVTKTEIVEPGKVEVLQSNQNQLVLQTCYPPGTSLKRLLVYAQPLSPN